MLKLYTDGSSNYKKGLYGSGYVLVENDTIIFSNSIKGKYEQFIKYNNVAGEIFACLYGIEKCIELGYNLVIVNVDYNGLIMWRNGTWKAKNELSQLYIKMLRHYEQFINIEFNKVKAHSKELGDKWNELADELAKNSIQQEC